MVADISILENNGREFAEAAYNKRPGWHGLGQVYFGEQAPTSDEILSAAGLDKWTPQKKSLNDLFAEYGQAVLGVGSNDVTLGVEPSEFCPNADDHYAVVRSDNNRILGTVKGRYELFCHSEGAKFLDSLIMDGIMRYEAAFALGNGERVCLLARMPKIDEPVKGDVQLRYITAVMNHDGSGAIQFFPTSLRVECANMLAMALQTAKGAGQICSVRHTASLGDKLERVRLYLSQFDEAFDLYNEKAKFLAGRKFDSTMIDTYLETLYPTPTEIKEGKRVTKDGRALTTRNNNVNAIKARIESDPANNIDGVKGTAWALFNAVTGYIDHDSTFKGGNDVAKKASNRFWGLTNGPKAEFKRVALDTLVGIAS